MLAHVVTGGNCEFSRQFHPGHLVEVMGCLIHANCHKNPLSILQDHHRIAALMEGWMPIFGGSRERVAPDFASMQNLQITEWL